MAVQRQRERWRNTRRQQLPEVWCIAFCIKARHLPLRALREYQSEATLRRALKHRAAQEMNTEPQLATASANGCSFLYFFFIIIILLKTRPLTSSSTIKKTTRQQRQHNREPRKIKSRLYVYVCIGTRKFLQAISQKKLKKNKRLRKFAAHC